LIIWRLNRPSAAFATDAVSLLGPGAPASPEGSSAKRGVECPLLGTEYSPEAVAPEHSK